MRSDRLAWLGPVWILIVLGMWQAHGHAGAQAGALTVSGSIALTGRSPVPSDMSGVVVWLTPVRGTTSDTRVQPPARPRFRMVQRGKKFLPSVLVVPTGSVVDFPNFDPIFHNVFSLFEGKRFDLGLYEAGTSRSVTFASPGVSHVFCNIHPDMSAVVVAVDTDYYTTSSPAGSFSMTNVPPGRYRLGVWHDRFKPESASEYPRDVTLSAGNSSLGALRLVDTGRVLTTHKNKFGHDYIPPNATAPIYRP